MALLKELLTEIHGLNSESFWRSAVLATVVYSLRLNEYAGRPFKRGASGKYIPCVNSKTPPTPVRSTACMLRQQRGETHRFVRVRRDAQCLLQGGAVFIHAQ